MAYAEFSEWEDVDAPSGPQPVGEWEDVEEQPGLLSKVGDMGMDVLEGALDIMSPKKSWETEERAGRAKTGWKDLMGPTPTADDTMGLFKEAIGGVGASMAKNVGGTAQLASNLLPDDWEWAQDLGEWGKDASAVGQGFQDRSKESGLYDSIGGINPAVLGADIGALVGGPAKFNVGKASAIPIIGKGLGYAAPAGAIGTAYGLGEGMEMDQAVKAGGIDAALGGIIGPVAEVLLNSKITSAQLREYHNLPKGMKKKIDYMAKSSSMTTEELVSKGADFLDSTTKTDFPRGEAVRAMAQTGDTQTQKYVDAGVNAMPEGRGNAIREAATRTSHTLGNVKPDSTAGRAIAENTEKVGEVDVTNWPNVYQKLVDDGVDQSTETFKRIEQYSRLDDVDMSKGLLGQSVKDDSPYVLQAVRPGNQASATVLESVQNWAKRHGYGGMENQITSSIGKTLKKGRFNPKAFTDDLIEAGVDPVKAERMAKTAEEDPIKAGDDIDPELTEELGGKPYDPYENAPPESIYEPGVQKPSKVEDGFVREDLDPDLLENLEGKDLTDWKNAEGSVSMQNIMDDFKDMDEDSLSGLIDDGLNEGKSMDDIYRSIRDAKGSPGMHPKGAGLNNLASNPAVGGGAVAGVEVDEEGNLGYDPLKGALGAAAGAAVGTKTGRQFMKDTAEHGINKAYDHPLLGPEKILPSNSSLGQEIKALKEPGGGLDDTFNRMVFTRIDNDPLAADLQKLGPNFTKEDALALASTHENEQYPIMMKMIEDLNKAKESPASNIRISAMMDEDARLATPKDREEFLGRKDAGYEVNSQLIEAVKDMPNKMKTTSVGKWLDKQVNAGKISADEVKGSQIGEFLKNYEKSNPGERISSKEVQNWVDQNAGKEFQTQSGVPEGMNDWSSFTATDMKVSGGMDEERVADKLYTTLDRIMLDDETTDRVYKLSRDLFEDIDAGVPMGELRPRIAGLMMDPELGDTEGRYIAQALAEMDKTGAPTLNQYEVNFKNYEPGNVDTAAGQIQPTLENIGMDKRGYIDAQQTLRDDILESIGLENISFDSLKKSRGIQTSGYKEDWKSVAQDIHNLRSNLHNEGTLTEAANTQIDEALGKVGKAEEVYKLVHGKKSGGFGDGKDGTIFGIMQQERKEKGRQPLTAKYRSGHMGSTEPYHTRTSIKGDSLVAHELQSDFWAGAKHGADMPFEEWVPKAMDDLIMKTKSEGKSSLLIPVSEVGSNTKAPPGLGFRDDTAKASKVSTTTENFYGKTVLKEAMKAAKKYGLDFSIDETGKTHSIKLSLPKDGVMQFGLY